jgi:hypothetical protein
MYDPLSKVRLIQYIFAQVISYYRDTLIRLYKIYLYYIIIIYKIIIIIHYIIIYIYIYK